MPAKWPPTPFRPLNLRWCGAPAQSARDKALRLDARRLDLAAQACREQAGPSAASS